jgi:hypothetical protein
MTITDRRYGVLSGVAAKAPCRTATTAPITLSGLQSVNGVTVAEDDRVLVKDQSDSTENGIYVASSGNWTRAADFDSGDDVVNGTHVFDANANALYRITIASDFTIDDDAVTFTLFVNFDGREILTSNRTINVPADYATVQLAVDAAAALDFNGKTVTIQLAAGTYTGAVTIGANVGQTDSDNFIITGASATETDFIISTTSANGFTVDGGRVTLKRLKIETTTAGYPLRATGQSYVKLDDVNFGAAASGYDHINIDGYSVVEAAASYTISGGAASHVAATRGGFKAGTITATVSGTPAFTQTVYVGPGGSVSVGSVTWSGSATGSRFLIDEGGLVDVGSGGLTALPGDAAGTITAGGGGRYVGSANITGHEAAKVWGTVTVSAATPTLQSPSYNVTSITDTGTGILTVTIATDFADAHYAWNVSVERAATALTVANLRNCAIRNATLAVGAVDIECWDDTATTANQVDPASWHFIGFGTQL